MKCTICKNGETKPGLTSSLFERDGRLVVIRNIPAEVCQTCGEAYTSSEVTDKVLKLAEKTLGEGERIQVREYSVA